MNTRNPESIEEEVIALHPDVRFTASEWKTVRQMMRQAIMLERQHQKDDNSPK